MNPILPILLLVVGALPSLGAAFKNLNFQSPNVRAVAPPYGLVKDLIPGWQLEIGQQRQEYMLYNNICTTCASAMLFGPDVPRRGDRFVFAMSTGDRFGAFSSISIYQTGDVPSTARSIMFATDANFDFSLWHISLGGQQLYFQDLGEADLMDPDFPFPGKAYGADVSQLAGTTAELRFTAFPSPAGIPNGGSLDFLRFSSTPVPAIPEPSTWALLGTGVAAFGWHHRRGRRRY